MMCSQDDLNRPPLGFVVEGDGEFHCFRSLIARGLGIDTRNLPIVNSAGCGSLAAHLEEKLVDLIATRHPRHVVVTVDARDFRDRKELEDCIKLRRHLQDRADAWLASPTHAHRCIPLPESIIVVVQDRAFESWLIADLEGLCKACELVTVDDAVVWTDVDTEVENPGQWLEQRLKPGVRLKDPFLPKKLAKFLSPDRMAKQSRSFRKFWKEVNTRLAFLSSQAGGGG